MLEVKEHEVPLELEKMVLQEHLDQKVIKTMYFYGPLSTSMVIHLKFDIMLSWEAYI